MSKFSSIFLLSLIVQLAVADEHDPALLKKAPVVLAGIESLHSFKKSFEAQEQDGISPQLGKELVGFNSKSVEQDAEALVYNIPNSSTEEAPKLQDSSYDCHFHKDEQDKVESAHCDFLDDKNERAYAAAQGVFTVDEFQDAAISFVSVFEEAFGDPAQLSEVKFWRSFLNGEANIQVKYQWPNAEGVAQIKYMYCHKHAHGDAVEMDCHRQRDVADPFQPNRLARAERFQP